MVEIGSHNFCVCEKLCSSKVCFSLKHIPIPFSCQLCIHFYGSCAEISGGWGIGRVLLLYEFSWHSKPFLIFGFLLRW